MTARTCYPPRAELGHLAEAIERAGGVEAVADRLGLTPEFVRECLVGEREWPEWGGGIVHYGVSGVTDRR
ncbi:MAG TPA: hypothetical protein VF576_01635 [Rubricoccaceae bacterium]|jgi:hypothetical protein